MNEMRLPEIEKTVKETIEGKEVEKEIYGDGSYGIRNGNEIKRYFPDDKSKEQTYVFLTGYYYLAEEKLSDGTVHRWYSNGLSSLEKLPDGTVREWFDDGQISHEKLPDGTETKYDFNGEIRYHATDGVEDTKEYRIAQRVKNRKQQVLDKLKDKPKLQNVIEKVAENKIFNKIAMAKSNLKETVIEKAKSVRRALLLAKNRRMYRN